jgi:ethanolamine permease
MAIGIIALLTGRTSELITISVFGALTLYMISMISLLRLRKKEPQLERPFKVPMYPLFPVTALMVATFSLVVMAIYNAKLALIYFLLLGICYGGFKVLKRKPANN